MDVRCLTFEESSNLRDLTVEDNVRKRPLPVNNSLSCSGQVESFQRYSFFMIRTNKNIINY